VIRKQRRETIRVCAALQAQAAGAATRPFEQEDSEVSMKRRAFLHAAGSSLVLAGLLRERACAENSIPAELAARRLDGNATTLRAADVEDLRAALRGPLVLPGDSQYDTSRRIWNAVFDRRPALIVRCAGAADIARALQFAGAHQLLTAVRGGGHSLSGQSTCDGGLVIDLSLMRSVHIDPHLRSARIEPGVLLGELDREALAFGLVTTTGTVSHTGAAGLTLAGGVGRLARRFGLAIDNLLAIDIVTPDGKLHAANDRENPDLYWGARGGGGNFGVVSSFEYRLRPFDATVFGGQLMFPLAEARRLLDLHAQMQATAPDEMWTNVRLVKPPSGVGFVEFDVCYSGPVASGERLVKPLLDFGRPLAGSLGPASYRTLQTHEDQRARHGLRHYHKAGYLIDFTPELFDALVAQYSDPGASQLQISIVPWGGGVVSRVSRAATAFWHRNVRFGINVSTHWEDPAHSEQNVARPRAAFRELEKFTQGFYGNSMTDRSAADMGALYGGNLARMTAIKRRYDPRNQLRLNANVIPTPA
jgi:FAD/FMN-containing dehydrogenase